MSEPWTEKLIATLRAEYAEAMGADARECGDWLVGAFLRYFMSALSEIERLRAEVKKREEMVQGLLRQQQDLARRAVALLQPFTGLPTPDFSSEREGWQAQVADLRTKVERLQTENLDFRLRMGEMEPGTFLSAEVFSISAKPPSRSEK